MQSLVQTSLILGLVDLPSEHLYLRSQTILICVMYENADSQR